MEKNWNKIVSPLKDIYSKKGMQDLFEKDSAYLKKSFIEIEDIWEEQFNSINKINYVLFSEAPLWGNLKKYMYNQNTSLSQFFYKSDLEFITGAPIKDKAEFLKNLSDLGLIILDISPFAFNETDTELNYRTMSKKDYFQLVSKTNELFLQEKLKKIKNKTTPDTDYFFRYLRVKNLFQDIVFSSLKDLNMIEQNYELREIAQKGGGIDRKKLQDLINIS